MEAHRAEARLAGVGRAETEGPVLRGLPVDARRRAHLDAADIEVGAPFLHRATGVHDVVRPVGVSRAYVGEGGVDGAEARADADPRLLEAIGKRHGPVERLGGRADGRPALRPVDRAGRV